MSDETKQSDGEESFFLTVLPFAGLGLLLVLAVVWRLDPQQPTEPGENPGGIDPVELAVKRWDQAPIRNIEIDPERDPLPRTVAGARRLDLGFVSGDETLAEAQTVDAAQHARRAGRRHEIEHDRHVRDTREHGLPEEYVRRLEALGEEGP